MAMPDTTRLTPLLRADIAGLAGLWPQPSPGVSLEVIESMQVLSLRHLPGGLSALSTVRASHAAPDLPQPGRSGGTDPVLIWLSPSETLLLTRDPALAGQLLSALRPLPGALACAIDLSAGSLVLQVQGRAVDALLSRLVDAQAMPVGVGQASRMRLADIAAVVWREAPDRVGILVDRANDHYLLQWLSYAAAAT